jgi:protein-tyrosine kinase
MSIIEQAARRLEELRRSGIEVPDGGRAGSAPMVAPVGAPPAAAAKSAPVRDISQALRGAQPAGRSSRAVQIDLARLASMGYLTPETPRAQIADEFRVIKRPLLTNLNGRSSSTIDRASLMMVTSSLPGEGKTFVAINLAISLAMELDTTVLLVDADVSRPSVLKRLGLPQAPGLLDLLTDSSLGMSDVLLRTNIEKLTLLPAGRPQGRATELLASEVMTRLLDEMASRYSDRILVFDAPPLLPSTESRVLATHMGQVIVVVEAERTHEKTVAQAMATIESCPVVMPLLNKISRSEVGSYYGYYDPSEG